MAPVLSFRTFIVGLVLAVVTVLFKPVNQRLTTFGIRRPIDSIPTIHGAETNIIPGTLQCEDVHHHKDSGLLFAGCQSGDLNDRYHWFPPLGIFKDHKKAKGGGLFVIDPKTFKSKQLELQGFTQDLVTHGIDVISNIGDTTTVYIFVVNHLPNPAHYRANGGRNETEPKARSQVEVFTHKIGTNVATYQRTVRSPLITTPNDIVATSPTGFYVTNDHYYREGVGRMLEDMLTRGSAPWSNIVFVTITDRQVVDDPEGGIYVFPIMRGLHNNNGLGHPSPHRPHELLVTDAGGGVLYRLQRRKIEEGLKLIEGIQLPISLDNPSWYEDEYKTASNDASGYILAGLARAIELPKHAADPNIPSPLQVYHIRASGTSKTAAKHAGWEQRLIFSDKGTVPRTASAAVIIGIDPEENGGRKQGWLFITGFMSVNMVATKIDL